MAMVKKEGNPELNTFTLLNPDFALPKEEYNFEMKLEKETIDGNISENHKIEK
jgi:hypothetical protein